MLLLKIVNKSIFSFNIITQNYLQYLYHKIKLLRYIKEETFSFYLQLMLLFILIKLYSIKIKTNFFILYILFSFYKHKLINYIININLLKTNTIINFNDIKGNPKLYYSAGMFNLQKKQKIKQPKATITILRVLLGKSKTFKTNPAAVHVNNLIPNHQSYIFKRLKQKILIKSIISYNYSPHNGCRLKKKKRLKIRTKVRTLMKE
jgi:ribosomal protein S11